MTRQRSFEANNSYVELKSPREQINDFGALQLNEIESSSTDPQVAASKHNLEFSKMLTQRLQLHLSNSRSSRNQGQNTPENSNPIAMNENLGAYLATQPDLMPSKIAVARKKRPSALIQMPSELSCAKSLPDILVKDDSVETVIDLQKAHKKKQLNLQSEEFQKQAEAENDQFERDFRVKYPQVSHYILKGKNSSSFANFWSKIILFAHTYNIFTCFWYIVFPGFPSGEWFFLEIIAEFILVIDLILRQILRLYFPQLWENMWVLHNLNTEKPFHITLKCVGSIPQSFIIGIAFRNNDKVLHSFWIACLRLLKLIRFRPFHYYFDTSSQGKENPNDEWIIRVLGAFYNIMLVTNFVTICWLLPERHQDGYGWWAMAGYYKFGLENVADWQKYLDAMLYSVSTMHGTGFGNILPIANAEYVIASCVMITGVSIYAGCFSVFAVQIDDEKKKQNVNAKKFEQAKLIGKMRYLPEEMQSKLRYYFNNLRINFEDFKITHQFIQELPKSLSEHCSLIMNNELISNVNFFQLATPSFIKEVCLCLKPQIFIINDHIIYRDDIASKMYFIHQGVCEVIAEDDKTTIRFLSKGGYFGEIGVLLTGKRTSAVVARTTTIVYSIKAKDLLPILKVHVSMGKYLRAVARQRLQTTKAEDIIIQREEEDFKTQFQLFQKTLPKDQNVFEKKSEKTDSIYHEFTSNMQFLKLLNVTQQNIGQNYPLDQAHKKLEQIPVQNLGESAYFTFKDFEIQNAKPKFWQTKQYSNLKVALIVPLSPLFIIWNIIVTLVIFYDLFVVLFAIAYDYDFNWTLQALNIICNVIYILDIPFRARTAFTTPNKFCFNPDEVLKYYIDTWFKTDLIASLPLEFLILAAPKIGPKYVQWVRLLRLVKCVKLVELNQILESYSNTQIELLRVIKLGGIFGILCHFFSCGFMFIGVREVNYQHRFDGKTLFTDIPDRNYVSYQPLMTWSKWDLYKQMFFQGACMAGATLYGDWVPQAPSEIIFTITTILISRLYLAYIFGECASYLGLLYEKRSTHNQNRDRILNWMHHNQVSVALAKRVKDYEKIIWQNFKGVDEEAVLKELPISLRDDIRRYTLKALIQNWELFPQNNPGALYTLIKKLKMVTYPKLEYIILQGEVADRMYFIVKGIVEVRSEDNKVIATLKQGQNFGEMALIKNSNRLRSQSVVSVTVVQLAQLMAKDFNKICKLSPDFEKKIEEIAKERQFQNVKKSVTGIKQTQSLWTIAGAKSPSISSNDASSRSSILSEIISSEVNANFQQHPIINVEVPQIEHYQETLGANQDLVAEEFKEAQNHRAKPSQKAQPSQKSGAQRQPFTENRNNFLSGPDRSEHLHNSTITERIKIAQIIRTDTLEEEKQDPIDYFRVSEVHENQQTERAVENDLIINRSLLPEETNLQQKANISQVRSSSVQSETKSPKKNNSTLRSITKLNINKISDFEAVYEEKQEQNAFRYKEWVAKFIEACATFLSIYNFVFIPLQVAYRIPFKGIYLVMEILTIVFYLLEVIHRISILKYLSWINFTLINQIENIEDRKLKLDHDAINKKIKLNKWETALTLIAVLPLNLIIDSQKAYEPWGYVQVIILFRYVKVRPFLKLFKLLKSYKLNQMRILECAIVYYIGIHYFACFFIAEAVWKPDARETWLRKVPYPQLTGIRSTPNVFDDVSKTSLYLHAQKMIIQTFSHVGIGDTSTISLNERFMNGFLIWFGTVFYCMNFGNVTAIVASLGNAAHVDFYRDYNLIIQKIRNGKVTKELQESVRDYFDNTFAMNKGLNLNQLKEQLPSSMSLDLQLNLYQEAVERSLVFRDPNGNIDVAVANSIFRCMQIISPIRNDFLVKAGYSTENTYIVLEGKVKVYGITNELLGVLTNGSHFGLDLSNSDTELSDIPEQFQSALKMDSPQDNFRRKSTVHLVTQSYVTIGLISKSDRKVLYKAYPTLKYKMQMVNRLMFQLGKRNLEQYARSKQLEPSRVVCENMILNHITYSTEQTYKLIIGKDSQESKPDLLPIITHLIVSQEREISSEMQPEPFYGELKSSRSYQILQNYQLHDPERIVKSNAFSKLICERRTVYRQIFQLLKFLNLVYIAFFPPFSIVFDKQMPQQLIAIEIISLLFSLFCVIIKLRTPELFKREKTVEFRKVLQMYYDDGLIPDLFGLCPFNVILGIHLPMHTIKSQEVQWLVLVLRCLRMISIWRCLALIRQFEIYLKKRIAAVMVLKAAIATLFFAHWVTCLFLFLVTIIEREEKQTWATLLNLYQRPVYEQYNLGQYCVMNIVTSLGSGDMFPSTDKERLFFTFMMTSGDLCFAFAFGLITNIMMENDSVTIQSDFEQKITQLEQFMEVFKISEHQKERVQKYFAYEFYQNQKSSMLDTVELLQQLPQSIVEEIIFQTKKEFLQPMFKDFGSENLIKELCFALTGQIYLPQDYIILKDTIGAEMYFIVEGSVHVIAADKITVVKTLSQGDYFGEIAILFPSKRVAYVQAATFCLVNCLKKADLDRISKSYLQVAQDMINMAKLRKKENEQFNTNTQGTEQNQTDLIVNKFLDHSMVSDDGTETFLEENLNQSRERLVAIKTDRTYKERFQKSPLGLIEDRNNEMIGAVAAEHEAANPMNQQVLIRKDAYRRASLLVNPSNFNFGQNIAQPKKKDSASAITEFQNLGRIQANKKNQTKKRVPIKRRLSGVSLGKNLMLSQTSGLKLQWNVKN